MKTIRLDTMEYYKNQRVMVHGWAHGVRAQKHIAFINLRDGWGTGQAVAVDPAMIEKVKALKPECALEVIGTVVTSKQARDGVECRIEALRSSGGSKAPEVDVTKKKLNASASTLLDHAAIVLRKPERRFRHRVAALTTTLFREFLNGEGFTEIHTPKIAAGTAEGGSDVFGLDYFGKPAFLNQSPQLYKQIAVGVFEAVYEVAPVFRAEAHATVRHLNEYTSLDVEIGFIRDHREIMELLERLIRYMVKLGSERVPEWPERFMVPWPRISHTIPVVEFRRIPDLISVTSEHPDDLSPADEKALGEWTLTERDSDFVFIEGFPLAKRPFYTMPDPDRPGYSASFDLLFRGQELVTGGQRLHAPEAYYSAMERRGIDPGGFSHYLEAFEAGMPPHGGFAIGLERWIQSLLMLPNIRDAAMFPRDCHRLMP